MGWSANPFRRVSPTQSTLAAIDQATDKKGMIKITGFGAIACGVYLAKPQTAGNVLTLQEV